MARVARLMLMIASSMKCTGSGSPASFSARRTAYSSVRTFSMRASASSVLASAVRGKDTPSVTPLPSRDKLVHRLPRDAERATYLRVGVPRVKRCEDRLVPPVAGIVVLIDQQAKPLDC